MHVTLSKPSKHSVPPRLYGGAERIVYWLGKALVELGHQVTLIANPRSHIPGVELRPVSDDGNAAAWLKLVPDSTDIVHCHFAPDPLPSKPFLFTVHGNGKPGERFHRNALFVSKRNAFNHGSRHFVYNGLDPAGFQYSDSRDDYAVFLAKARWKVKNFKGAVEVVRRAGVELRVVGSRSLPWNLQKFLPAIRGVRYYGSLAEDEKRKLISRARCLIFPVRWEEPGSLALLEALVSGCYVVGTPYGCLPEVITPDVGMLDTSASVLAKAVRTPERFDPQTCRNRVLQGGFTHLDMARNYLKYYERILTKGTLDDEDAPPPATRADFNARILLPWED